jgi:endonuclease/exonuclease/phosphatase family metal-dependent hydrolase
VRRKKKRKMMRVRLVTLGIALIFAALSASAESVRVASYNIRNYTGTDRITESGWTPGYPKPEEEKDALRAVILAVKPDVIVFQEMGPAGYLEELRLDLSASGLAYPYSAHLVASDPERCLAALSRIPIENMGHNNSLTYSVNGDKSPVKRGLLSLSFTSKGRAWTLYDIHLKSRAGNKSDEKKNTAERNGEASAIRNQIQKEQSDNALWILAGDTNDTPTSGAWNRFLAKGERKLGVDLRPKDSKGEFWTYYYKKLDSYERIDLIMASPAMAELVKTDSAKIYDGSGAEKASDHRLVYVDLEFR